MIVMTVNTYEFFFKQAHVHMQDFLCVMRIPEVIMNVREAITVVERMLLLRGEDAAGWSQFI